MNVYEIVTKKMIEKLEAGVAPWHMPWAAGVGQPCNLISGKTYRGINPMLLGCDYSSKYWLTFNQVKKLGGQVRAGEKSSMVVFFKMIDDKERAEAADDDKTSKRPFLLRYYNVFNVQQVEGLQHDRLDKEKVDIEQIKDFNPIANCEKIWSGFNNPPQLQHYQQRAFYRESQDLINMPQQKSFYSEAEYYCTLFHESIHSTGHESRVHRKNVGHSHFGSKEYSKEELIAEMGAAMLCTHAGIDTEKLFDNSASYLQSWANVLKDKKNFRCVVDAASAAQKAVDYILGNKGEEVGE